MANIPIVEGGDATYHFKTLVPAVAAGAIIGKGGETIAAIQKDTGARVKMSKSHDFYPGNCRNQTTRDDVAVHRMPKYIYIIIECVYL